MVATENDEAPAAAPASPSASDDGSGPSVGIVTTAPVDDEAFETLAAEIKEVLAELAQDKAMDAFRGEYEKLFAALEKSHANEKRLDTKCDELASEIANQQARVDGAHDTIAEDAENIASLKKEIEKAWKMVDMTQEREERARETIETLNTEIQNLTKVIEEKTLGAEDTNLNELRKLRDELTSQRDNLKIEAKELAALIDAKDGEISAARAENTRLDGRLTALTNELQARTNEMNREIRRKERTEREVKQLRAELEEKQVEIGQLAEESSSVQESVSKLEGALVEQRKLNDGLQYNLETLNATIGDLEGQLEANAQAAQIAEQDCGRRVKELAERDAVIEQGRAELARAAKEIEELRKRLSSAEAAKGEVEAEKGKMREEGAALRRQIDELMEQALVERRRQDEKKHEVSVLQNNAKRSLASQTKLQHDLQATAEQVSGQRRRVAELEGCCERQSRCIATVEAERDHYLGEAQDLAKRVDALLDDMSDADGAVFTFKKELAEMESKLKQQQNKYQAARNDRTMLNKNLTGAQDEIADLRGKLRVFQHQFDQLKEEMVAKEAALAKAAQDQQRLLKEKEDLALEVEASKGETRQVERKNREVEKNLSLVRDRHRQQQGELDKCRAQLEDALRRRSLSDNRLGEREEQLGRLRKKDAVQERVLARGEAAYRDRLEDVRVLKLEVKRLNHEAAISAKSVRAMDDLKQELLQLQKDLLAERARVRSLQSEVESPLNVHRWRKLEGNDPSSFELIQKVQALQRRLIARKEDLVERDLALLVKERTNGELRTALARQEQGKAAEEEARLLRADLRAKEEARKGAAAENNLLRTQLADATGKVERMAEELHEAKKKLLAANKRVQKLREAAKERPAEQQQQRRAASAAERTSSGTSRKFAGGGFRLSFDED